jgi:hypothetical protein
LTPRARRELEGYARDTWRSFLALVVPESGLPADYVGSSLAPSSRAHYSSPTNIAMYLWATLGARDLGIIPEHEAEGRARQVLGSLSALERHSSSGQFYNWYNPYTLEALRVWPEPPGGRIHPFASSVDNGWLAATLLMLGSALPALQGQASKLLGGMSFAAYYDPHAKGGGPGLLRGGFWCAADAPPGASACPRGDYAGTGETVVYTGHHYGALNTETRITSYVAIALGQVPAEHYFAPWRTFPDGCEWSGQKARPSGAWHTYRGVPVFEGAYTYRSRRVVPSWGGSMFEALMPALVVPEASWGPRSWGVNHACYVASQIEFGLEEARYGYWGFSPSKAPNGGYREYGVAALGMEPRGYAADAELKTLLETGWDAPGCWRAPAAIREYGQGVVTPHAVFLALGVAPEASIENLSALRRNFPHAYGPGGFKDAINVATGQTAGCYLALDQGMVMAAVTNILLDDRLQSYLAPSLRASLEPLMALETFGAAEAS